METVKKFFKKKTVGFYLSALAALLSFITAIVYAAAYRGTQYMNWGAFVLLLFAFIGFAALSIFDVTARFAPVLVGLFGLISFGLYVLATYMYLSEVFYNGVTAAAMAELDPSYVFCLIAIVLVIALSIAGIFMRQRKRVKADTNGGETAADGRSVSGEGTK